jgi:hypothetical protein
MTERACRATTSRLLSQQFIHHEEVKTLAAWGEVTITTNAIAIAYVPDYHGIAEAARRGGCYELRFTFSVFRCNARAFLLLPNKLEF